MFANRIVLDEYGHVDTGIDIDDQTALADLVRRTVQRLNGKERTLVTAEAGPDRHCAVGGSSTNGVVAYCTFDNMEFHQLIDPSQSGDDIVTVVAGGQPGDSPHNYVVNADVAIEAMVEFATNGKLSDNLNWISS